MKKRSSLMKMILLMAVGGLAGGCAGLGMMLGREKLVPLAQDLQLWMARSYLPLQLAATLLCGGAALYFFRRAKPLSGPETGEGDFERGEKLLFRSMTALSVLMLLSLTLFGCYGAGLFRLMEEEGSVWLLLLPPAVLLASVMLVVYGQVRQVRLTQLRNPEKRGNPLEMTFQKDWLASCDEAERYQIYRAGYHSYRLTNTALMVAWVAAVLLGMVFGTGLLPVLLVGALLGVHTLSYYWAASHDPKTGKRPEEERRTP